MRKLLVISLWLLVVGLGLASGVPPWRASTLYRCKTQDAQPTTHDPYYQKLYEDLLYPSVKITSGIGTGSGVVISIEQRAKSIGDSDSKPYALRPTLYVLTAAHVVGDEAEVKVEFFTEVRDLKLEDGSIPASVVITDTLKDLALLKITSNIQHLTSNIKPARLAPRNYTPYIFTPVWVVGCSLGLDPRPSEGIITSIEQRAKSIENSKPYALSSTLFWEMSAPIAPGNSGGGVFLKDTHELIGIAVWVRGYRKQLITTMAGIVPLQDIYKFLDNTPLMNCEEHKSRGETAGEPVESESTALSGGLVNRPYSMKGGEK